VMHGPTHGGGAVAALRNVMHPAAVARLVMKRTDHCLLVGEGALKFARAHGVPEVNLLTDEAREIWLHWKETNGKDSDWVAPPDDELSDAVRKEFKIRKPGTIHCSALDTHGDLGCVTTTSGLYYKIPGRVGDSPILGAGLWLDNEAGSAGSTGRGEANLLNLSSHTIVEALRRGLAPKDAVVEACKRVVATNRDPRLRDAKGRPNFDVKFYCVSKDGRHAGASLWPGAKMAVHDGDVARLIDCTPFYEEPRPC
jgi:N4-(beta-N-acetylglucosaminyl)-L-asparaginase